jgi:hypothetical protein
MKYTNIVDGVRVVNKGVWVKSVKEFREFIEEIGFKRVGSVNSGGIYYELKEGVPIYVVIDSVGGKLVDNKVVRILYKYLIFRLDDEDKMEEVLGVRDLEEFLGKIREEWDKYYNNKNKKEKEKCH